MGKATKAMKAMKAPRNVRIYWPSPPDDGFLELEEEFHGVVVRRLEKTEKLVRKPKAYIRHLEKTATP